MLGLIMIWVLWRMSESWGSWLLRIFGGYDVKRHMGLGLLDTTWE